MKIILPVFLLFILSCKSAPKTVVKEPMSPRKAAIAQKMLCDIYTLHFDIETPAGHPAYIEEHLIKGWEGGTIDTINREYFFEKDKLLKVKDDEFHGHSEYIFKYDEQGRRTLIDQQTPKGSFHKDTFEYHPSVAYDAIRTHYMFNKREDQSAFMYYGASDSMIIDSPDGPENCIFKEKNDTILVIRTWRNFDGKLISLKMDAWDKLGRKTGITYYENGNVDRTLSYTYDAHNNMVLSVDKNADHIIGGSNGIVAISKPDTYTTVYEYDDHGNWTKRTEQNSTGKYTAVTVRKITYEK